MRYLMTPVGSFGDLHPYIAVAIGLRARGHDVSIATSEIYREKVEGEGLRFHPLRPEMGLIMENPEMMRRAIDPRRGTEFIFRQLVQHPRLEEGFEDTLAAAQDADVLIGHPIAFATPIVADYLNKPWISIALQPAIFLSAYDPPALPGPGVLTQIAALGPWPARLFFSLARAVMRRWGAPVNRMRVRLGLRPVRNPLLNDMLSPWGTQAWFSRLLAAPQRDWPPRTTVTGFPFYDRLAPGHGMSDELKAFLAAGTPPVVFTLGSIAVFDAGSFYGESLRAAREVGCRAVLLTGADPRNKPRGELPPDVFVAEYAPYSELLPQAAATVHQGGIGTTAQALRAGRPMIVTPLSHDQPDNARRVARLGAARVIPRAAYKAERVAGELRALLANDRYAAAARHATEVIAGEDGVDAACQLLEAAR